MTFPFHVLCTSFVLLIVSHLAAATSRNITIDDALGDEITHQTPIFAPAGAWAQGSECLGCLQPFNRSKIFKGTWHDSTHYPGDPTRTVTFSFNGSAIYVYCILANNFEPGIGTLANYSFTIDNDLVGQFTHIPDDTQSFQYNQLVYANTSIPSGPHTFSLVADSQANGTLILFDYAQYTYVLSYDFPCKCSKFLSVDVNDLLQGVSSSSSPANAAIDLSSTSPAPTNTQQSSAGSGSRTQRIAEIVAGVLGGISVIGLGLILYLLRHRIWKKKNHNPEEGLRMSRPERPTVNTGHHPGPAINPRSEHRKPGPEAITPFPRLVPPNLQRSEKESRERLDSSPSTAKLPPSTPTGSSSSRPSAGRQVSFDQASRPPDDRPTRKHKRRHRGEESSSGRSGDSSHAVTSHSDGRDLESRTRKHTGRHHAGDVTGPPISSRGRSGSGSPSRRRPPEGSISPSPLGQSTVTRAAEESSRRRPRERQSRATHASDGTSSPSTTRRGRTHATNELESLKLAVDDLREQQRMMITALQPQPDLPPPSYEQPPTP